MSIEVEKAGRGRPSKYGKNNEKKDVIAADLRDPSSATAYYIQKLMDMGFMELKLTEKGEQFIASN